MGNSSASVSDLEIGNTDASHAICSIIASGDTPESTPVEVASTGSVHGVNSGVSTESAAPVGRSFSLDPPTAASPGLSSGSSTCGSIALVSRDAESASIARSRSGSAGVYGSTAAVLSSAESAAVACGRVHRCRPLQLPLCNRGLWVRVQSMHPTLLRVRLWVRVQSMHLTLLRVRNRGLWVRVRRWIPLDCLE